MSKTLTVIEPFLFVNVGDTFELSKDGKSYILETKEEINGASDSDTIESSYYSKFTISTNYAKSLIKDGYLNEVVDDKNDKFINIFNEIDKLLEQYTKDLNSIDDEYSTMPQCLKVEKITVLNNLIKVLSHLKRLKK